MSKNELRSSGKHRRGDFANGASELVVIILKKEKIFKKRY